MRKATGPVRVATLSIVLGCVLAFSACGSDKNGDEDTSTDTLTDSNDLLGDTAGDTESDTIPDPTTEPPEDHAEVTPDTPADIPTEGGTGVVGDSCATQDDCGGIPSASPNCMTDIYGMITFPNGYCSADCITDADCGAGSTCFDVMGFMQFCMKDCTDRTDCREDEGYSCSEVPYIGGGPFCLPAIDIPDVPPDTSTDVYPDMPSDTGTD